MRKRLLSLMVMGATAGLIPVLTNAPAAYASCPPSQGTGGTTVPIGTPATTGGAYAGNTSNGYAVGVSGTVAGGAVANGFVEASSGQGVAASGSVAGQAPGWFVAGPTGTGASQAGGCPLP